MRADEHGRLLPAQRRARPLPPNRLYQPGLNALGIYPTPNTSRGSGLNYASQAPTENPIRQDLLRMDLQATDSWRVTGRIMNTKNNSDPALRHDVGGRRQQQPRHHRHALRDAGQQLHDLGGRRPQHDDVTRTELGPRAQLAGLHHPERGAAAVASGLSTPLLFSERGAGRLHPGHALRRRARRQQRRVLPDRPRAVHQREHDPRRHREPDQGLGRAHVEGRLLLPAQLQAAEHLLRASTARSTSSTTPATRSTPGSATPTRSPASSTPTRRPRSTRCPSGATRTSSSTCRTTGR